MEQVITLLVRTSASRFNKAETRMADFVQIQRHIGIGVRCHQPMTLRASPLDGIWCLHQSIVVALSQPEQPTVHMVRGGRHDWIILLFALPARSRTGAPADFEIMLWLLGKGGRSPGGRLIS